MTQQSLLLEKLPSSTVGADHSRDMQSGELTSLTLQKHIPSREITPSAKLVHDFRNELSSVSTWTVLLSRANAFSDEQHHSFRSSIQNIVRSLEQVLSATEMRQIASCERINQEIFSMSHLLSQLPDDNPKHQKGLLILRDKFQIMQKLTEDLLGQSPKSNMFHSLNFGKLVLQEGHAIEPLFISPKKLTLSCTTEESSVISGNHNHLKRVVHNLLKNALDFSSTTVEVKLTTDQNWVHLSIKDDGVGIDEDILPRVFDEGFTTRSNKGGSGIGLANVRDIIADHGGTIKVFSEGPGKGTTFTVSLPLLLKQEEGELKLSDYSMPQFVGK